MAMKKHNHVATCNIHPADPRVEMRGVAYHLGRRWRENILDWATAKAPVTKRGTWQHCMPQLTTQMYPVEPVCGRLETPLSLWPRPPYGQTGPVKIKKM